MVLDNDGKEDDVAEKLWSLGLGFVGKVLRCDSELSNKIESGRWSGLSTVGISQERKVKLDDVYN